MENRAKLMLVFVLVLASLVMAQGCGGSGSVGNLRGLAESYSELSAAEIKSGLDTLNATEHQELEIFAPAFKQALFRQACSIDPAIRWTTGGQQYDCNRAALEYQQALQWVLPGTTVETEVDTQRLKLLNYYKCSSGEIDKTTCSVYMGVTAQVNQASAETTQTIINNIGGTCTVGKDPGCYP